MAYNIGDRVTVNDRVAVVTDRMYSARSEEYLYSIKYQGMAEDQDDLYTDGELAPFVDTSRTFDVEMEIEDGVVIFSLIAVIDNERRVVARNHGNVLRNDALGVVQAASYAVRKAFLEMNNGNIYLNKEEF